MTTERGEPESDTDRIVKALDSIWAVLLGILVVELSRMIK